MPFTFSPLSGKFDYYKAPITDHGALTGLLDDDHTQYVLKAGSLTQITTRSHTDLSNIGTNTHAQIDTHIAATGTSVHGLGTMSTATETNYALLAGRATPQTLAFGTTSGAATGYLTSTSHATKGKYFLNSAGTITVDEANVRLGVGIAIPTVRLDIDGITTTADGIAVTGNVAANGSVLFQATNTNTAGLAGFRLAYAKGNGGPFLDLSAGGADSSAPNQVNFYIYGNRSFVVYTNAGERMRINGSGYVGINDPTPDAQLDVQTSGTAVIGQIIQATASQTADLLRILKSDGTIYSKFNNIGNLFLAVKSGATQAGAGAAAGEVWKTASHATLPDNVLMIGV